MIKFNRFIFIGLFPGFGQAANIAGIIKTRSKLSPFRPCFHLIFFLRFLMPRASLSPKVLAHSFARFGTFLVLVLAPGGCLSSSPGVRRESYFAGRLRKPF